MIDEMNYGLWSKDIRNDFFSIWNSNKKNRETKQRIKGGNDLTFHII